MPAKCKMKDMVCEEVQPQVIRPSDQLLLANIFNSFYKNLKKLKRLPGAPKMADRVQKGVCPLGFGHYCQLSPSEIFFYSTTPSMKIVDNGGKTRRTGGDNIINSHH